VKHLRETGTDVFSLPETVTESDYMRPDIVSSIAGRKFSPDFFRYLHVCLRASSLVSGCSGRARIVELGGGVGNLARLMNAFLPDSQYVVVDIPETLFFSYLYLSLNYPGAKILLVEDESQLASETLDDFDFILAPTLFAERFCGRPVDLFVNTASLGEMKNSVIQYWMRYIESRLKPRFVYMMNRYVGFCQPERDEWRLDENQSSVLFGPCWEVLSWRIDPPHVRAPYYTKYHPRYLEVVARHVDDVVEGECVVRSNEICQRLVHQDWFSESWPRPVKIDELEVADANVQARLSCETGMDSPLFLLWESIRLHPNKQNVRMMLQYLEKISPGRGFLIEEIPFYEQLLESLERRDPDGDSARTLAWIEKNRQARAAACAAA
jgi:hypothetical protein